MKPAELRRPPTRDGVSASSVVLPGRGQGSLFDFMCERFPAVPPTEWHRRFELGLVLDAHGQPLSVASAFQAHSRVHYYRSLATEPRIPFDEEVLFQDDRLVVVDKPHFLPVTPSGRFLQETLLVRLKNSSGIESLSPVHRLDRETAGIVVFCVRPEDRAAYHGLFAARAVEKLYEAVAGVAPDRRFPLVHRSRLADSEHNFMQMVEVPGEHNAETHFELLKQGTKGRALYAVRPRSGQRHQIRVHMAALGIPILGDRIYPDHLAEPPEGAHESFDHPLQLLARAIEFRDPVDGRLRRFESRRSLEAASGM